MQRIHTDVLSHIANLGRTSAPSLESLVVFRESSTAGFTESF